MPRREGGAPGCSLLLRNLSRSTRPEDLRYIAEKYGRVRDIYLPRDFYTGEPRGIGFLEYTDPRDAEDARDALDRALLHDREISVVFAKEGRKAPDDYRPSRRGNYGRRSRSPPRRRSYSPRKSRRSYSRSPSRERIRSSKGRERRRSPTRSPSRSASPKLRSHSPVKDAAASRSPQPQASPQQEGSPAE